MTFRQAIGFVVLATAGANAERVPLKRFGPDHGLPAETVRCIHRDSVGFLWLCSAGLTRFDGVGFQAFGVKDGLPTDNVSDILEVESGVYLVATGKGLIEFRPDQPAPFQPVPLAGVAEAPEILKIYRDPSGGLWCVALRMIWKLERTRGKFAGIPVDLNAEGDLFDREIAGFVVDEAGVLWVTMTRGRLYRRAGGHWSMTPIPNCIAVHYLGRGEFLCGYVPGISLVRVGAPGDSRPWVRQVSAMSTRGPFFEDSRGKIWVRIAHQGHRLAEISRDHGRYTFRVMGEESGLPPMAAMSFGEHPPGHLWIGYGRAGLWRYTREGIHVLSTRDGVMDTRQMGIAINRRGRLQMVAGDDRRAFILHQWMGDRFESVRPWTPPGLVWSWGSGQVAFEDSRSQWWVPTARGVFRYPRVNRLADLAHTRPDLHLTTRDGLASDDIFRLYEDRKDNVWIFCIDGEADKTGLSRWNRASRTLERIPLPREASWVKVFLEDRDEQLWIAADRALFRIKGSTIETFWHKSWGMAETRPVSMYQDQAGTLWMTTTDGLLAVDSLAARQPRFRFFTGADGLPHNHVETITQDRFGRYYISTPKGIHRFDPATGSSVPLPHPEGVHSMHVMLGLADLEGNLWFQADPYLLRLVPGNSRSGPPPPVRITGVRTGGRPLALSMLGAFRATGIDFRAADRRDLAIDYVAPFFASGVPLRYQRKLEGADATWSEPVLDRSIQYANLAPGDYRFHVRAVDEYGRTSEAASLVSFRIPSPFYLRWWFVLLSAAALGGSVFAWQQMRIRRLRELAALREHIAQDLHDDLGASLTKIAVLSEVAQSKKGIEPLEEIARTSRELIDALGYTVWAISPRNDNLRGLVRGTRRVASEVFHSGETVAAVHAPDGDIPLPPDLRRQAFFMFKEALNNAARHAHCTEAEVRIAVSDGVLAGEVRDNGCGFVLSDEDASHGLSGLRQRANRLGGEATIESQPGQGTVVTFRLPLQRRSPRRSYRFW
jgi:signal transduction histidine kinase/ligand-binding sensor domain-containing protein